MDWQYIKNSSMVYVVHIGHWILYLTNALCVIPLILYTPIYIWLPLFTIIGHPIISGAYCGLNNIENMYRQRLGWRLIEMNFIEFSYPTIKKFITRLGLKK